MHRFLKLFIAIILIWTITLPWTLNYLSEIVQIDKFRKLVTPEKNKILHSLSLGVGNPEKVIIAVVACGGKPVNDSITLLKSAILTSNYYGLRFLDAIIFADDDHLYEVDLKVRKLSQSVTGVDFRYEIHPVIFPVRNHDVWMKLFKPCASQRLFLHAALPHISEILYLDVDTLVVGDLRNIWGKFKSMSSEQNVGLVVEHEVSSVGWYNRFARHPFYPPLGLNTGVMLMNLTRLRKSFNWEHAILRAYKKYKDKIVFGDQDLINIIFHDRPDLVYLLPCLYNFRPDHCQYGINCPGTDNSRNYEKNGSIQILHGNRDVFHNENKFPIFSKVYKYFQRFDMAKDDFKQNIITPLKAEMNTGQNLTLKSTLDCDNINHLFFYDLS